MNTDPNETDTDELPNTPCLHRRILWGVINVPRMMRMMGEKRISV